MMAAAEVDTLSESLNSVNINGDSNEANDAEASQHWEFPLEDLYRIALSFYKGSVVHFLIQFFYIHIKMHRIKIHFK